MGAHVRSCQRRSRSAQSASRVKLRGVLGRDDQRSAVGAVESAVGRDRAAAEGVDRAISPEGWLGILPSGHTGPIRAPDVRQGEGLKSALAETTDELWAMAEGQGRDADHAVGARLLEQVYRGLEVRGLSQGLRGLEEEPEVVRLAGDGLKGVLDHRKHGRCLLGE